MVSTTQTMNDSSLC